MSKTEKDLFGGSECSDSSKKVYSSYLRKLVHTYLHLAGFELGSLGLHSACWYTNN